MGFNTQVITLWCFYIVGREILTLGEGFNTQVTYHNGRFLHVVPRPRGRPRRARAAISG
jgi:hypothetical protein